MYVLCIYVYACIFVRNPKSSPVFLIKITICRINFQCLSAVSGNIFIFIVLFVQVFRIGIRPNTIVCYALNE